MITLQTRIDNIIKWFKENHSLIDYVSYNNVLQYFSKNGNRLRADWEVIRREKGTKFLFKILTDKNIPFITESEYKKILLEKEKDIFKEWILSNYNKPDRLSYLSILKYLEDTKENELKRIFCKLYGILKQKGLIEFFNQIGLTFYIQDNKKDFEKIKKQLLVVATKFYKKNKFTPGWTELEECGFNETKYIRTDGWNINWTIDNLNDFYLSNNLPKVPSKSEKSIDEVMKMDTNKMLDEVVLFFGNIPSLRNLKSSDKFYDLVRYIRSTKYHSNNLTENYIYEKILEKRFGKNYINLTKKLISLDGYWCESIHELMVFNYLYLNGISHNPHVAYSDIIEGWETNYISDTIIDNNIVCEIAGYDPKIKKHEQYWSKILEKETVCITNNKNFIKLDGYRFINTKLEDFLDYIHTVFSSLFQNTIKPDFFKVIKSQHTSGYLKDIMSFFQSTNHITIEILKESLSKESFRFFMNYFQSIKKFKEKYDKGFHKEFDEIKNIEIDFNKKTYSKVIGMSEEEKINRGLLLLSELILEKNLGSVPNSRIVGKIKKYRTINDMFETENGSYWVSINKKEDGYDRLCNILGYLIPINNITPDYYSNIQNLRDDLVHMKKVGSGFWVGKRSPLYKTDNVIRRIHNYISRELTGVIEFREKYKSILDEINFEYKGKNTKFV